MSTSSSRKSENITNGLNFSATPCSTLVISEHLVGAFPESPEGRVVKTQSSFGERSLLAAVARRLDLGGLLRLGRGEELTQGREKPSILANTFEAIVAALYLDGGIGSGRSFVLRIFAARYPGGAGGAGGSATLHDYKTRLQEWCQKQYDVLPHYTIVKETGPDHQKTFDVQLTVRGEVLGVGVGRTKKEAEQMAAKQALTQTGQ